MKFVMAILGLTISVQASANSKYCVEAGRRFRNMCFSGCEVNPWKLPELCRVPLDPAPIDPAPKAAPPVKKGEVDRRVMEVAANEDISDFVRIPGKPGTGKDIMLQELMKRINQPKPANPRPIKTTMEITEADVQVADKKPLDPKIREFMKEFKMEDMDLRGPDLTPSTRPNPAPKKSDLQSTDAADASA